MDVSPEILQIVVALAAGVALSASCGFRVFIPPLIMSLASMAGFVDLPPDFAWLGTWQAALALGAAALLEIAAYYIPAVDNLLDTVSAPASAIAGTVLTAALLGGDISPALRWTLAAIAGGGTALTVSSGTAAARGASTATTGGLGNGLLATGEIAASAGLSILSLALPVLALVVAVILVIVAFRLIKKMRDKLAQRRQPTAPY